MTATELARRHLKQMPSVDQAVASERWPVEQVIRSEMRALRANFCESGGYAISRPDHYIEAPRDVRHVMDNRRRKSDLNSQSKAAYASHWGWLGAVGLAATAIGLIVGIVAPGPLTGAVFPIGVTVLLVVAYGARPRSSHRPL